MIDKYMVMDKKRCKRSHTVAIEPNSVYETYNSHPVDSMTSSDETIWVNPVSLAGVDSQQSVKSNGSSSSEEDSNGNAPDGPEACFGAVSLIVFGFFVFPAF